MTEAVIAMNDLEPAILANIEKRTDETQKKSWEYLLHHKRMYEPIGRAILLILDGDRQDGEIIREGATHYAWEHEDDIQPVLDTMYFYRMMRERITIDTRAEFAGV